jgi:hypothetical protein
LLTSSSGCFFFTLQTDGNAVIYRVNLNNAITSVFSTQTSGTGADRICMQTDGNLVIYSGSTPHFNTASSGTAADHVIMQDDGNLVVYSADRSQYFWNAQVSFSGVTCPAPTTTTTATTEAYTLPATTARPGCDITRFLFDTDRNFLKLACWVKETKDQVAAVDYCRDFGMRLFVPSSAADISAIAATTLGIFGKGGYTSIWVSGTRRAETPWRNSNSGGGELFVGFTPGIVEYAGFSPSKCLSLSSFGVDGYQLVTFDCYEKQSFWCEF